MHRLYRALGRCVHEGRSQRMESDDTRNLWLRPREQVSIAALLASALVLMAAAWWRHGGHRGELVDIDRAPPLVAKFQVDVNRADWPELVQLPGVGQVLAERLIAERERGGEFRSHDDLSRVRGIGPRTLERIRPYLLPIPTDAEWAQR
jgi:competence protein ComEA